MMRGSRRGCVRLRVRFLKPSSSWVFFVNVYCLHVCWLVFSDKIQFDSSALLNCEPVLSMLAQLVADFNRVIYLMHFMQENNLFFLLLHCEDIYTKCLQYIIISTRQQQMSLFAFYFYIRTSIKNVMLSKMLSKPLCCKNCLIFNK